MIKKQINSECSAKKKKNAKEDKNVKHILKEISQLKHQLTSMKSSKVLMTKVNEGEENMQMSTKRENKQERKQRFKSELQVPSKIHIHMNTLCCRNRQIKLKSNICLHKIKGLLERSGNTGEMLSSQINALVSYIDNQFQEYEYKYQNLKEKNKSQEEQIISLTGKVEKLVHKSMTSKEAFNERESEIDELRRSLSYYLEMMKSSKEEAENLLKENTDLEVYVHELQENNAMMRAEVKRMNKGKEQMEEIMKECEVETEKYRRQAILKKQDLNGKEVELEKIKKQKKDLQSQVQQLCAQIENLQDAGKEKDHEIRELSRNNKEILYDLATSNESQAELSQQIEKLKQDQTKLTKTIEILRQRYETNQAVTRAQQGINEELRRQIEQLTGEKESLMENLSFCQEQIENLSEEIDQLKRANERYKNMYFRNKIRAENHEGEGGEGGESKMGESRRNRSAAMSDIFKMIDRHKKIRHEGYEDSSDSQQEQ